MNPLAKKAEVARCFAVIQEYVLGNPELHDAVRAVLLHEQEMLGIAENEAIRSDLPSDVAHAQCCEAKGEIVGVGLAARLLVDSEEIRKRREMLESELKPDREGPGPENEKEFL